MPVEFWSEEPEDNRSIDEIMRDQAIRLVTSGNRYIGMRVRPSSACGKGFSTLCGKSVIGTIVTIGSNSNEKILNDMVTVKLDGGHGIWWYRTGKNVYPVGTPEGYDLIVIE